jgi:Arc/MetJ-type ribon-helix-helix transcriptional regulator
MPAIKVSISLDDADLAYLDQQASDGRFPSRSAAVQEAIRLLRESRLADSYVEAFASWVDDDWDSLSSDGIAAR